MFLNDRSCIRHVSTLFDRIYTVFVFFLISSVLIGRGSDKIKLCRRVPLDYCASSGDNRSAAAIFIEGPDLKFVPGQSTNIRDKHGSI
ncbi:hypothetical protein DPMN_189329 [Dreissena polymorpha]|uniref:Uncharacterized protein n=1 Tax=Dreissena polymorpha TaxID=45954 RepID=A0A9D4DSZ3_DREPO|nr:hypothetical protein DPMN_189329 [Dreissena polymorpha]